MENVESDKAPLASKVAPVKARPTYKGGCPEQTANICSQIFFFWVNKLIGRAREKGRYNEELEHSDLFELPPNDRTGKISDTFEQAYIDAKEQLLKEQNMAPGVLLNDDESTKVLMTAFRCLVGRKFIIAGMIKLFNSSLQFGFPIILGRMLIFIQEMDSRSTYEGYLWAGGLGLAMGIKALTENNYFYLVYRCGWQLRSAVTTGVYRKSLRLTAAARQQKTIGEIVNLMQLDATKIEQFMMSAHVIWDGMYQIIGYMAILYWMIGPSCFVGLAVMMLAIPIMGLIMGKMMKLQRSVVGVTDKRVKLINECLQGILGVKMSAWESQFTTVINGMRKEEIAVYKKSWNYHAFMFSFMSTVPTVTAVAALSVYAINGGDIQAAILFSAVLTFGQLRFPLLFYPRAIAGYAQFKVSVRRVAHFLAMEEIEQKHTAKASKDTVIQIVDGQFFWGNPSAPADSSEGTANKKKKKQQPKAKVEPREVPTEPKDKDGDDEKAVEEDGPLTPQSPQAKVPALSDINLTVNKGELLAVVGSVASGKSSLCSAMLGEMYSLQGSVDVFGKVAYAAQTPWILHASVRDNILFGEAYDEKRYQRVIEDCQLKHDLDILQDRDMTMIGERGINLSGGQKQRISVARAAYSSKEIVILDDPLSALDPEVAQKLFERCICKFMKSRTVVLVTNQLSLLSKCDRVLVIVSEPELGGCIAEQGTYDSLVANGKNFSKLMQEYKGGEEEEQQKTGRPSSAAEERQTSTQADERQKQEGDKGKTNKSNAGTKLHQEEERAKGSVPIKHYISYLRAGGLLSFFGMVLPCFIISQGLMLYSTAWITVWTEDMYGQSLNFYLGGYALIALALGIFSFVRGVSMAHVSLKAAKTMHKNLLISILNAPMAFFDTTPLGRVISRFSKDTFALDNTISRNWTFFLFTSLMVVTTLGTITYTTPLFSAAVIPLIVVYFVTLNVYRPVARDVKRLDSIFKSPVYSHFQETLGGLSTIRAYAMSSRFQQDNSEKVDRSITCWYATAYSERWLSTILEILGTTMALIAALLAIMGGLSPGMAGLSLTMAISVTSLLNQTVRSSADLEAAMNSVERLVYYSTEIAQEPARTSQGQLPTDREWPASGKLAIKNLQMRYRSDTALVLKGIDLDVASGQRIGLVGRTGAGKSSLMLCVMRLVEMQDEGTIEIDDVNISKLGLQELRSKVGIVPQNPVIFSGTIRSNLDPFGTFSDEQLWGALEKCTLKPAVEELENGLDGPVAEFGDNFSQGQRQLFCLARSLLHQYKVMLLDEATSSVDFQTDKLIQQTIRANFSDCTILTIAHRINTVIDNDKIAVLEDGKVAEFDSPKALLSRPDSMLSQMVDEMGVEMAKRLRDEAK